MEGDDLVATEGSGATKFGWDHDPGDPHGVVRARTKLGQFRIWRLPRVRVPGTFEEDMGGGRAYPGLYILIDQKAKRAYVGESSDLKDRVLGHCARPPMKELAEFDLVYLMNDGRSYAHSVFTEETLRKQLEYGTIELLSSQSSFEVLNTVHTEQRLASTQRTLFQHLAEELGFVLHELRLTTGLPPPPIDDSEIPIKSLSNAFPGKHLEVKGSYAGVMGKEPVFISKPGWKPKGLQFTIRASERFKGALAADQGYLCIRRGPGYLIPLSKIKQWLGERLEKAIQEDGTVDIFLSLKDATLTHGDLQPLDVAPFRGTAGV